jgi:hypothetical protein
LPRPTCVSGDPKRPGAVASSKLNDSSDQLTILVT